MRYNIQEVDDDQNSDRPSGPRHRAAQPSIKSSNTVTVRSTLRGRRLYRAHLERLALRVMDAHGVANTELSILIAGDAKLRRLNREYRNIDRPTDVLSFAQDPPYSGDSTTPCLLGDIVISADRARRQAREAGVPLQTELSRLVAHGVLHLLGYDHHTEKDAVRMSEAEEDALGGRTGLVSRDSRHG